MARAKAVPAEVSNVGDMFGRIREADQSECYAAIGASAESGLLQSFAHTSEGMRWAVVSERETIAIFGCAATAILSQTGIPWMVGTDRVAEFPISFARGGRRYVREMLTRFSYLENWVDVRNELSIKWLKWCGFHFDDPIPYGYEQKLFYRFWMKRK